jgi:fluoride exporter
MTGLAVVVGAMVGAPLRYLTDRAVQRRHDSVFPWGTFVVNVVGSFVLGVVAVGVDRHALPGSVSALLGPGFCGALTTYSTFSYESVRLVQDGARLFAAANVALSIAAGLAAAVGGAGLAVVMWR